MKNILLFAFTVVSLYSCTCEKHTRNTVADLETRKAIQGVQILTVAATDGRQSKENYTFTDSLGSFESGFSSAGIAKCPSLKLTLSKTGYTTERVVEPIIGDTIFLKRLP